MSFLFTKADFFRKFFLLVFFVIVHKLQEIFFKSAPLFTFTWNLELFTHDGNFAVHVVILSQPHFYLFFEKGLICGCSNKRARQRSWVGKKQCEPLRVFLQLARPHKINHLNLSRPKVSNDQKCNFLSEQRPPSSFLSQSLPGHHKIIKRGADKFTREWLLNVFLIYLIIWSTKVKTRLNLWINWRSSDQDMFVEKLPLQ